MKCFKRIYLGLLICLMYAIGCIHIMPALAAETSGSYSEDFNQITTDILSGTAVSDAGALNGKWDISSSIGKWWVYDGTVAAEENGSGKRLKMTSNSNRAEGASYILSKPIDKDNIFHISFDFKCTDISADYWVEIANGDNMDSAITLFGMVNGRIRTGGGEICALSAESIYGIDISVNLSTLRQMTVIKDEIGNIIAKKTEKVFTRRNNLWNQTTLKNIDFLAYGNTIWYVDNLEMSVRPISYGDSMGVYTENFDAADGDILSGTAISNTGSLNGKWDISSSIGKWWVYDGTVAAEENGNGKRLKMTSNSNRAEGASYILSKPIDKDNIFHISFDFKCTDISADYWVEIANGDNMNSAITLFGMTDGKVRIGNRELCNLTDGNTYTIDISINLSTLWQTVTINDTNGNIIARGSETAFTRRYELWDGTTLKNIDFLAYGTTTWYVDNLQISVRTLSGRKSEIQVFAEIDFNNTVKNTGMSILDFENEETERMGRKGVILDKDDEAKRYIRIDVDDEVLYDISDDIPIEITVEYFDEGEGFFELLYDAYGVPQNIRDGIWGREESVCLTNTKEWKTHTFYIENMRAANRGDGFDFRIGVWSTAKGFSPESVVIGSVMLQTVKRQNLIRLTGVGGSKPGNIYTKGEEITVQLNITNKSEDDMIGDLIYKIKNENGELVENGRLSEVFRKGEITPVTINPAADKYGIYGVSVEGELRYINNPNEEPVPFSAYTEYSVAWEVPKENINDKCGTALLINSNHWSAPNGVAAGIAAKAGVKWCREEIQWSASEASHGVYKIPDDMLREITLAHEAGMNVALGLLYANPIHYDSYVGLGDVPTTESELAAYSKWCEWLARETKGIAQAFYIWNEYNIYAFNILNETPEHYVNIMKAAYEGVKKGNPEAIVIGLETAQIDNEFNKRVFEAGGLQYMDVAGVHPYDWSGHFDTQRIINMSKDMQALMREHGDEKPIWWTELGFGSYYTLEEQRNNLVMAYALKECYALADTVFQFRMQDDLETNEIESKWGFLRSYNDIALENCAKPSYIAVCAMNNLIGGKAEAKNVIKDDTTYAFHFYNNELQKDVILLQSEYDAKFMTLDLGVNEAEVYDVYGNRLENIMSENGIYDLEISTEPIYLAGKFNRFEQVGKIEDIAYGVIKNGDFVDSFSELKVGDEIKVKLHRKLLKGSNTDSICIQAFYDDDGLRLMQATCENIAFEDESDYWIGCTDTVPQGASQLKIFIWNYNTLTSLMRPIILKN